MSYPTNEDRATWAHNTLGFFAEMTCMNIMEELDSTIGDLLANIMHLCKREGLDFEDLLCMGRMHFECELEEEAEDEAD